VRRKSTGSDVGRILLLAAVVLIARPAAALSAEWVFKHASRSVAMVYAADPTMQIVGRGSGVFIMKDLLVTNCHVIARGKSYMVGREHVRAPGRLVAFNLDHDLCALRVAGFNAAAAAIGEVKKLRVGQRIYAIGTPEGFELTLSEGLISGLRETRAGRYIQTSAALSEGSSGGGLFDATGRLIGITSFVYSHGQNLGFAAPADWAVALAKRAAAATDPVELPQEATRQWRHPLLK